MAWTLARYAVAVSLGLWSLLALRMVFVYLGFIRTSAGIEMNLPFATRSLGTGVACASYAIVLFCFSRGTSLVIALASYWVIRYLFRSTLYRLWFRYLAHVAVDVERRLNLLAVQETTGPEFEKVDAIAYAAIKDSSMSDEKKEQSETQEPSIHFNEKTVDVMYG